MRISVDSVNNGRSENINSLQETNGLPESESLCFTLVKNLIIIP